MRKAQVITNFDKPWDEIMLRCAVGCDDFMVFTVEDISDPGGKDWWVEVSLVADMRPHSFWDLLTACWELFRRGRWHRASADLNRHNLARLRDWCQYALDKTEGPQEATMSTTDTIDGMQRELINVQAAARNFKAEAESLKAKLEQVTGLLLKASDDVHLGFCEQDDEGQWMHHPSCDDSRSYLDTNQ